MTEPVLVVLGASALAAATAALGVLPFVGGRSPRRVTVGVADGVASGLMLGGGYLLMSRGLTLGTLPVVVGAVAAVAYTWLIQRTAGVAEIDAAPDAEAGPEYGYQVLLQNALHAAAEGVAIGVAMVLDLRLGVFLALALALHNVAEAMALTEVLRARGVGLGEAAGLCVATNVAQPLLALAVFALHPVLTGLLPVALGFAAGTLVFLVLTEVLPASYERAGDRVIALSVSVSLGLVVLLADLVV